jgi:hypothetical protein
MPSTLLRIPVAEDVFLKFDEQAKAAKKPVEYLIAERLPQLAQSDSVKPIVIDDQDRRRLEQLLGKNFSEPHELISMVQRALTLAVGDATVELSPYLLDRLKSRCFGMPFDKFVAFTVKRALEEYAGVR